MSKKINKYIFWIPRIFSIIFLIFLALTSLDVFSMNLNLGGTIIALFLHNTPTIILLIVLIISWKYEIVGGITFILAGIIYIIIVSITAIKSGFEWYYLSWTIQISGFSFFIGIIFIIGWYKKNLK